MHRISQLLIKHETIDRDQFARLVAGEGEETVFGEPAAPDDPGPQPKRDTPSPKPGLFPLPSGSTP